MKKFCTQVQIILMAVKFGKIDLSIRGTLMVKSGIIKTCQGKYWDADSLWMYFFSVGARVMAEKISTASTAFLCTAIVTMNILCITASTFPKCALWTNWNHQVGTTRRCQTCLQLDNILFAHKSESNKELHQPKTFFIWTKSWARDFRRNEVSLGISRTTKNSVNVSLTALENLPHSEDMSKVIWIFGWSLQVPEQGLKPLRKPSIRTVDWAFAPSFPSQYPKISSFLRWAILTALGILILTVKCILAE